MEDKTSSSSNSPALNDKLKTLLWQGVIGALSLISAAAVPILVQRFLGPTPPVTPASTLPAAQTQIQADPSGQTNLESSSREDEGNDRKREKHKKD